MHFDPDDPPLQRPVVRHLDDFERLAVPGAGITWIPVRHTLDIRAFGTNAYEAEAVGLDIVEPHDERPSSPGEAGHQELYFVARGRARFILDGHEHDAPAGTYVFIPDPRTHRYATAEEAGTVVLSFGGPPTFQPSLWESTFRAMSQADSDPEQARALMIDAIGHHPDEPELHYNAARLEARLGDLDAALKHLEHAVLLDPTLAEQARTDRVLAPIAGRSRST